MDITEAILTAASTPNGIRVSVTDLAAFKTLFERERERLSKSLSRPDLWRLFVRQSPTKPNEVWIIRNGKENGENIPPNIHGGSGVASPVLPDSGVQPNPAELDPRPLQQDASETK